MKKAETKFRENKVQPFLMALPRTWWMTVQQTSRVGDPDIIACVDGQFVALELKKDSKEVPKKIQLLKARLINDAGGLAFIVCPQNWEFTKQILKGILNDKY